MSDKSTEEIISEMVQEVKELKEEGAWCLHYLGTWLVAIALLIAGIMLLFASVLAVAKATIFLPFRLLRQAYKTIIKGN